MTKDNKTSNLIEKTLINNNYSISLSNCKYCNISLLHNTPLPPSQALFKAFHLINKEWPLTNSGALLQRLKLIGSSQNLLEISTTNYNSELKNEAILDNLNLLLDNNNYKSNSKKSNFHFIFKNIPTKQLPYSFPFSVVAYIEENEKNSNLNENNNIKNIRIIGHSRWALANSVFSKSDTTIRQVLMDSLVVDEEFRNYGIGKAILLYGEEILKRMKVQHIFLQTKHAKNFYLKYGYNESKKIPMIKIEKKIYDNIPLNNKDVDMIIENELSSEDDLKPRPFNFSNAIWMEKKLQN